MLVESGGDNLTATFSPALVDAQIFVLDVAGGGDVARKGGPGIERADLLVVNKTDLAPYVGVDVPRMVHDAEHARDGRPVLALSRTDPGSVAALAGWVRHRLEHFRSGDLVPVDPGPMPSAMLTRTRTEVRSSHLRRVRPGRGLGWPWSRSRRSCSPATTSRSRCAWAPGGSLEIVEPGGTVAYAMRGRSARWDVTVEVDAGGTLVWHGEPFVVAEGADVTRTTSVELAAGASVSLRETLVLGRSR